MLKPKKVKSFFFKDKSHSQVLDIINKDLPVNITALEDLVDRIYLQYPVLDKSSVSFIVRNTFESMRDLLILNKVLNFFTLFFDTKLHFYTINGRWAPNVPHLKLKMTTPPSFK